MQGARQIGRGKRCSRVVEKGNFQIELIEEPMKKEKIALCWLLEKRKAKENVSW